MSKRLIAAGILGGLFLCLIVLIQMFIYDVRDTPQYLQDAGLRISCDVRFLQSPTGCKIVESNSGIVASDDMIQKALPPGGIGCWSETEQGHMLPCVIDTGEW